MHSYLLPFIVAALAFLFGYQSLQRGIAIGRLRERREWLYLSRREREARRLSQLKK